MKSGPDRAWGALAFRVAAGLAFPRLTGTAGEAEARERVKGFFAEAGLRAEEEWFGASDFAIQVGARWALVPTGAMLLLAAALARLEFSLAALIAALLSFFPALYISRRVLSGFHRKERQARYECANIVHRPAADAAGRDVVLMAHYDSKTQTFPIWLRVALFMLAVLASLVMLVLISACAATHLLHSGCAIEPWLLPAAAAACLLDGCFIANRVGNLGDGALDNAASVGMIVETGARLAAAPPTGLRLWVAATAAEEIGLCGGIAFLEAHRHELDRATAVILNFDGGGGGKTVDVLAAYGLPPQRANAELVDRVKAAAAGLGLSLRTLYIPVGMATDLMPLRQAGYQGLDFLGVSGAIHTPRDRIGRVRPENLGEYVRIAEAVVRGMGTEGTG